MTRIIAICFSFALSLSLATVNAQAQNRATNDSPPTLRIALQLNAHAFVDIKNDSGYEIQLVKDFCATLHSNCKVAHFPRVRLPTAIKKFDFDIALPVLGEKDIKSVLSEPYYYRHAVLIAQKDKPLNYPVTANSLRQYSMVGYLGAKREIAKLSSIISTQNYQEVPSQNKALKLLQENRFDLAIVDYMSLSSVTENAENTYQIFDLFDVVPIHAAIPDDKIREQFNQFIEQQKQMPGYFGITGI